MKNVIGYAVLLILIGILYYFHFTDNKKNVIDSDHQITAIDSNTHQMRIAYINIDSLQNNYKYYQEVKANLDQKEKSAENEIMSLQKKFQSRAAELQNKSAQMTPKEQESAMMEINKMQQDFQTRQQKLHEDLATYNNKMNEQIHGKIETFLKGFNDKGAFSYIFSYEPGFMFYKDSTLDITAEVVKGLNESFEKEKK